MNIEVRRAEYRDVETMRDLYRQEAGCQIIHDSALSRAIADPYLLLADGRIAGYAGVWNRYYNARVMEFYTVPELRGQALLLFRELLRATEAVEIEAQTNMPLMLMMLYDCAQNIQAESILFEDAFRTALTCPDGTFRRLRPEEAGSVFEHHGEPVGDWVVEKNGAIVGTGGALYHYNPPYGDLYMEVTETARQQGIGSYLIQELKRTCYESGKKPAARCNIDNIASRKTLQKAGMLPCGRLLAGTVAP